VQARIVSIGHRVDIGSLRADDATRLAVNDIGHVVIELQQPLPLEPYAHNRVAGSLIVVDPTSNRTSGALLVNVVR
jgi:sulfate adenylyltransferase subunit 1